MFITRGDRHDADDARDDASTKQTNKRSSDIDTDNTNEAANCSEANVNEHPAAGNNDKGPTVADRLVDLAKAENIELFRDADMLTYARFERNRHRETWLLDSKEFELYLRKLFHEKHSKSPSTHALGDAVRTLQAQAMFDGAEHSVHVRTAAHGGSIYFDLADDQWRCVEITSAGWRVISDPPVRFRRGGGTHPLPEPEAGGQLDDLREFINVASDEDWQLLVGWLLSAARPPLQPFPLLALYGEQGSAKSTTTELLRSLLDPNAAMLRSAPASERDLAISANAGWLLVLDNLSGIPAWLSDALCRVATGGGLATRKMYSDDQERIFDIRRPVIVNGIDELGSRSDLIDRTVLLTLPTIPPHRRKTKKELWSAFERAHPRILGALFDALAAALARVDHVTLPNLPRMADFALWGTAAESSLGWPEGSFMQAYDNNRARGHELAIEANAIGAALCEIGAEGFEGNATELFEDLNRRAEEPRPLGWPRSP